MIDNYDNFSELLLQGEMLYKIGRFEESLDYFRKAEIQDAMNIQVYFRSAEALVMLDRYDEAKQEIEKALLIDKNSGEAYFHLGNIAMLQEEYSAGKANYEKAILNGFDGAQVYVNLAAMCNYYGDLENALFYTTKAIEADPQRADVRVDKIQYLIMLNKEAQAAKACDELMESHPDVFEGYHLKFLILLENEDYVKAEQLLNKASNLFPDDIGFVLDRAKLFSKKADFKAALKILDDVITKQEEIPFELNREKAKVLIGLEKPEESKRLFETITKERYDEESLFLLINLCIVMERFEDALCHSERIIAENSEQSTFYSALYFKGLALNRLGRKKEAKAALEDACNKMRFACSSNPMMLDLYLLRALAFKELGEYERALEMADYVLAVSNEIAEAHFVRYQILSAMGDFDAAETEKQIVGNYSSALSALVGG